MNDSMLLAQDSNPLVLFLWLGVLALLVFLGYLVISWIRKRLTSEDEPSAPTGFTLADLRDLHKAGKMTTEEFERAKAQMVASMKAAMARKEAERKKQA